jgi:hypothetical protein
MGAKQKLNAAHLYGALVIAGLIGLATQSWNVFLVALTGAVIADLAGGNLRR